MLFRVLLAVSLLFTGFSEGFALQKKYSDPLDQRAGWYSVSHNGGLTVTSQKSNLWKMYTIVGGHTYPLQRNGTTGEWGLGPQLAPGSDQYVRTTLAAKLLDLDANPSFTLNINGQIQHFTIDPRTHKVTVTGANVPASSSSSSSSTGGGIPVGHNDQATGTGTDSAYGNESGNSKQLCEIMGTSCDVTGSSSSSSSGSSGSGGAQRPCDTPGATCDITGSSSSSGGSSSGSGSSGSSSGSSKPPAACTGATKSWNGVLTSSDMNRDASFFQAGRSKWPVVDGVNGSKGSKPGMMNGVERLHTAPAPDGSFAILNYVPKGEVQNWNFFTDNFPGGGVDKVRAGMKIFIPRGFTWGHDQKIALGIWGGHIGCLGGGCPKGKETGFSIRLVHNAKSGAKMYSYHLDREQRSLVKGKSFGNTIGQSTGPLPEGQWNLLEIELTLNDPGKENAQVKLFLNGRQVGQTVTGLMYRKDPNWHIQGFLVNDMWGGTEELTSHYSPRVQAYWYKDYSISGCR